MGGATTTMSFRLGKQGKAAFEDFCHSVGMSVSTAINMFIKNVNQNRSLSFQVKQDPFYSKANMAHVHAAIDELENGSGRAPH
jgi:DNA-damage-inducible protein J